MIGLLEKILFWIDLPLMMGLSVYIYYRSAGHIVLASFIGFSLALISFSLWGIARYQLGKSFRVRAEAHQLVVNGLYSKIRHPIYLFGGLTYLCLFLAGGYYKSAIAYCIIYMTYQNIRIGNEESLLQQNFGDEYKKYREQTWL